MEPLFVIKIGGNVIDQPADLERFLDHFATIQGKKILVHGGGKVATSIGEKLGITSRYMNGRRITDKDTLSLVTMVYGGLINKQIVARLQSKQCNAIGITGADANLIPASKRAVKEIDYGFVGDVQSNQVPIQHWHVLLSNDWVPVVAPLTHDGQGTLLNTNADTIAQEVAKALAKDYAVTILYLFEKPGVLLDVNDESTVIGKLDPDKYQSLLKEEKIHSGMIPKLENAFAALKAGVKKVIIGNSNELNALITENKGTTLVIR